LETINNQDINKQLFSAYITDPVNLQDSDSVNLDRLLEKFPYCPILHAFSCKLFKEKDPSLFEKHLNKAAVYAPDRKVLYSLINQPESFHSFILSAPNGAAETESDVKNRAEVTEDADPSGSTVQFAEIVDVSEEDDAEYIEIIEEELSAGTNEEQVADTKTPLNKKIEIDEEEKVLLENIASADFFAFEKKLSHHTNEFIAQRLEDVNPAEAETANDKEEASVTPVLETQEVAKYDDDQMPYTFLWWLHKTRNEHADTYQPYVNFKLDTSRGIRKTTGEELDHQIKQNIFHLQSPLDEMEVKNSPQTIHFKVRRKEEAIIEKFIREEPQIKPPAPDRVDNENKARRSAEDPNDLVSETLASIYSEQMLFHKAIDTYKKLSLKFPEKRAYFADQIRQLEQKIN
jgi:hypothetical protein